MFSCIAGKDESYWQAVDDKALVRKVAGDLLSSLKPTNKKLSYKDMINHSSQAKLKPEKNSGLNVVRTHDLSDTGAVLYQLSYPAMGAGHFVSS